MVRLSLRVIRLELVTYYIKLKRVKREKVFFLLLLFDILIDFFPLTKQKNEQSQHKSEPLLARLNVPMLTSPKAYTKK